MISKLSRLSIEDKCFFPCGERIGSVFAFTNSVVAAADDIIFLFGGQNLNFLLFTVEYRVDKIC